MYLVSQVICKQLGVCVFPQKIIKMWICDLTHIGSDILGPWPVLHISIQPACCRNLVFWKCKLYTKCFTGILIVENRNLSVKTVFSAKNKCSGYFRVTPKETLNLTNLVYLDVCQYIIKVFIIDLSYVNTVKVLFVKT